MPSTFQKECAFQSLLGGYPCGGRFRMAGPSATHTAQPGPSRQPPKGLPAPGQVATASGERRQQRRTPTTTPTSNKRPPNAEAEKAARDAERKRLINRSKAIIRAIGFFYHLSITVLFTTFTELLLDFFDNHYGKTAAFLGMCAGIERAMQFFSSPFLGILSDSLGRRFILLNSLFLHCLALVGVTFAPGVETVLMYYIVNGAANVTLTMCNAVVTDLTRQGGDSDLARQYGRLGMAIGLSLVLGPAVGPSLSQLNLLYPLYVAILALVVSIILTFFMPETLEPQHHVPFNCADTNPITRLRAAFRYKRFVLFSFPFACTQVSECVYQFIILYAKRRFNWSFVLLGLYVSAAGVAVALVQGNLKYLVPRYLSERACVVLGLFGHALAMIFIGVSTEGWMMPLSVIFQMASSLRNPGLMSALSTGVPHSEQGMLQGSIQSIRVMAKAAGGPLFGLVMAYAINEKHISAEGTWVIGVPFLVAGGFDLLGMVVAFIIFDRCKLRGRVDEEGDEAEDEDEEDDSGDDEEDEEEDGGGASKDEEQRGETTKTAAGGNKSSPPSAL